MFVKHKNELEKNVQKVNLSVLESGWALIDEAWHGENVKSIFNRLYYIIEGNGAFVESEGECVELMPGCIYLIPSCLKYNYWCKGIVKKVFFHINIKRPDGYDAFSDFGRIGELSDAAAVKRISELFEEERLSSAFELGGELLKTVAAVSEKYDFEMGAGKRDEHSVVLRSAERYIQNNLSLKLTRKMIADNCKVSEGKLAMHFREELGVSVGKYIDDLVFMEAIRRLLYTDDSLGDISEDLGFCDQFYFSRRFSENYKISPLKYRQEMRKRG